MPERILPLASLGLRPLDDDADGVRVACVHAARHLVHRGARRVGLLPAAPEVAVMPVGVRLAMALAGLGAQQVAFLDANPRWPALPPEELRDAPSEKLGDYAVRWLAPRCALLTASGAGEAGAGVVLLERFVRSGAGDFAQVIVDLTGFRELGEHLTAIRSLDGVLVVARSRATHELDLLKLNHALPPERNLGVLLVGGNA